MTQLDGAVLYEPPRGGPPARARAGGGGFRDVEPDEGLAGTARRPRPGTYRVSASARAPGGGEESASATVNVLR